MDPTFDIDCPDCGGSLSVSITDVSEQRTVRCPSGHSIRLQDDGGGAREVVSSLEDLDKAIRRFGR